MERDELQFWDLADAQGNSKKISQCERGCKPEKHSRTVRPQTFQKGIDRMEGWVFCSRHTQLDTLCADREI